MNDVAFPAERFAGVERLYGNGSVTTLARAHVCVIGIGGVGSWAVEALADLWTDVRRTARSLIRRP